MFSSTATDIFTLKFPGELKLVCTQSYLLQSYTDLSKQPWDLQSQKTVSEFPKGAFQVATLKI